MRTRMSGGVGGGRSILPPTRLGSFVITLYFVSQTITKTPQPLLHRVVLNMPKCASIACLVCHIHNKLREAKSRLQMPDLTQKFRDSVNPCWVSKIHVRASCLMDVCFLGSLSQPAQSQFLDELQT